MLSIDILKQLLKRLKRKCKKRKIEFIRYFGANKKRLEKTTIGLLGLSKSVGTSHLSFVLANYLRNGLGLKVALIGFNNENDYEGLRAYLEMKAGNEGKAFKNCKELLKYQGINFNGIHYYTCKNIAYLGEITNSYDCAILDISINDENYREAIKLYFGCQKRFLLGSFSPYKIREVFERIRRIRLRENEEEIVMLTRDYNKKRNSKLVKEFNLSVKLIPEFLDIEIIDGKKLIWLDELIYS